MAVTNRRWARWGAAIAVVALLALAWTRRSYVEAGSLLARFADPGAQGFVASIVRHPIATAPVEIPADANAPAVPAIIYAPTGHVHAPGIVIVHGVHRLGLREPRLVHFARTIAETGYTVITPQVDELAQFHLEPTSIQTIGRAAHFLKARLGTARVGLMGLSFAGGLSVMAAADPAFASDIGFVVSVGGHHDLERVLRFLVTDEIPLPDGSIQTRQAHDYGTIILVYHDASFFFPAEDVETAKEALKLWLWEDFDQARVKAGEMSPAGRETIGLFFDRKTAGLKKLLLETIERRRPRLPDVSPHGIAARVKVPMFFLHGEADSVIPASESLWLAGEAAGSEVLVSRAISHVELEGTPGWREKFALVRFMAHVLGEADRY
jgi:pimeloyl-ACP methyl ester carboxylesterase